MTETTPQTFCVFLCHASEDKQRVHELYQRLTEGGIDAWLDDKKLLPGQNWNFEILKALRNANAIILCLSKRSVLKEGYVQKEIRNAIDIAQEKPRGTIFLIPVRLDDCVVPEEIADLQYVDLYASDGYEKLFRSLMIRADSLRLQFKHHETVPAPSPDLHYELSRILKDMLRDEDELQESLLYLAAREPDMHGWFHTEIRSELKRIMSSPDHPLQERVRAGNVLSQIGDPRFRADAWYLPDEENLGFVEIPSGSFLMGSNDNANSLEDKREAPQHPVILPVFFINRYAVTVAQYRAFLMETMPENAHDLPDTGIDNHPVTSVTWEQAVAYCHWLTDKLRQWAGAPQKVARLFAARGEPWVVTLPSEAEWEKAARRIGDADEYPWGMQPDPNLANYGASRIGRTAAVGCFGGGQTPDGLQDMSGNVWEWTRSNWGPQSGFPHFKYPYAMSDGREDMHTTDKMLKVIRGGSFYSSAEEMRCSHRGAAFPDKRYNHIGFRLVITTLARQ